MIELYRHTTCSICDDFEAACKEMVIAHKVIPVPPAQITKTLPTGIDLPTLKDSGQMITGQTAIAAHLKDLEKFVADWRRFQGDACYVDDDGEIC